MAKDREMKNMGSVMVVGAGIAGMQAALDLATAGSVSYTHLTLPTICSV